MYCKRIGLVMAGVYLCGFWLSSAMAAEGARGAAGIGSVKDTEQQVEHYVRTNTPFKWSSVKVDFGRDSVIPLMDRKPTASVRIVVEGEPLTTSMVKGIQWVVSKSVPGLPAEEVRVFDQTNRPYTGYVSEKRIPESGPEQTLVIGVPTMFQPYWTEYLTEKGVKYRFDEQTRAFYVRTDPIPLLSEAMTREPISSVAKRGLWERELESELRARWPEIEDPRVCIAFPDYIKGKADDAEPVAFIMAQGLSGNAKPEVRALVSGRVPGLPAKNVAVVGTAWRPRPSYEQAPSSNTKVAFSGH